MNRQTLLLLLAPSALMAETVNVDNSEVVHSARDFTATQGTYGWNHGYYNVSADGTPGYQPSDFQNLPWAGSNYALGGNPPWTSLDANGGHPNGGNNGAEHWVMRRFTVTPEMAGNATINWTLGNPGNPDCGDGVTGVLFRNGVQLDTAAVASNQSGVSQNVLTSLVAGDVIDLALTPLPGGNDFCDGSTFAMGIVTSKPATYTDLLRIADSVTEFSGVQGGSGWNYGYYNVTANGAPDPGGGDFIQFASGAFNGSLWDLATPAAPWTEVGPTGIHPNGTNNGDEHWVGRRYTVQPGEAGNLVVEWDMAKSNPNGGGVTGLVFHNGVQKDIRSILGDDTIGVDRGIVLNGVLPGDTIDLVMSPFGLSRGTDDGADGSTMSMRVFLQIPEPSTAAVLAGTVLALCVRRRRK